MSELNAPACNTIESLVAHFLRTVPETWSRFDPSALSEVQERALSLLTAAGMIERRVTLRLRMVGHPTAVEATITLTGETGLAQAMQFVLADIWNDWRESFEQRGDGPSSHCERIGNEQWRLTAEGVTARNDLDAGNASTLFDFVLRREFFDGQPRLMPDGRISQRLSVAGRGALVRMQRVRSDTSPTGVAITNWEVGGQAFATAFAELLKPKPTAAEPAPTPTPAADHPSFALLRVFTNKMSDERFKQASQVLTDDTLTVNDKLTKIDALMPFPPTASAEQLGEMLGVSKQAVMKTVWWRKNRRGESDEEIERRHAQHKERAKAYEAPRDDDEER
jgi:hypothetical protein